MEELAGGGSAAVAGDRSSQATCHVKLVGGGSVINGATPSRFHISQASSPLILEMDQAKTIFVPAAFTPTENPKLLGIWRLTSFF